MDCATASAKGGREKTTVIVQEQAERVAGCDPVQKEAVMRERDAAARERDAAMREREEMQYNAEMHKREAQDAVGREKDARVAAIREKDAAHPRYGRKTRRRGRKRRCSTSRR
ncbi:18 kDa seed maturation protein-like [Ipomoea triloba]|uniref:18 kDa seed maturation protein-like n=1 Tax=Ipomoea triloba TaxID=35885 RepID=UPI00125D54FE|nr:18 kDa seed maturation protein-like [Ipomoea triloba]